MSVTVGIKVRFSRIVIGQPEGTIAVHQGVETDAAFAGLLAHTSSNNLRLTHVASTLIDGSVTVNELEPQRPPPGPRSR